MNRGAYVFTFLALILSAILFGVLATREAQLENQRDLHQHIISADAFLEQFEQDLPRALRITGYRALLGLDDHVSATGVYLDEFEGPFIEMIMNGSINGTSYEVMEDATLSVFEQRMSEVAQRAGVDLSLEVKNVSAQHTTPFEIRITALVGVRLRTRDDSTTWNYTRNLSGTFSIEQLRDPLYTVGTNGRVPIPVERVNVSRPYITADNDTTRLQVVLNETQYHPDSEAPSLLMRFTGDFSASPHGIASLVDTKTLDSQDLPVHTDRSAVDFLYFGNSSTSTNRIVNMSDDFLLDDDHLDDYDAEGKTV